METKESKILTICVDKNNNISSAYLRTQVGTSPDGFKTLSIELKDKSIITMRLGEICNLVKSAGLRC